MHKILKNEIDLILPQLTVRKEKRGNVTLLISAFIALAYEGISIFVHYRRHKSLHKAVKAMETKANIQCNRLIHLEDSMVMYGVYKAKTTEKLVDTVHKMHNTTTPNKRLFTGDFSKAFTWYVNRQGVQHYAINLLLREKYVKMYEEFIMQLCIYAKAIRILAKGYLPISLITLLRLQEIMDDIKTAI